MKFREQTSLDLLVERMYEHSDFVNSNQEIILDRKFNLYINPKLWDYKEIDPNNITYEQLFTKIYMAFVERITKSDDYKRLMLKANKILGKNIEEKFWSTSWGASCVSQPKTLEYLVEHGIINER